MWDRLSSLSALGTAFGGITHTKPNGIIHIVSGGGATLCKTDFAKAVA